MNIRKIHGMMMLCVALLAPVSSFAQKVEPYPHLNSFGDKPADCKLAAEDAKWLEERIKEGALAVATKADIEAWEKAAKEHDQKEQIIGDCGRTFKILQKLEIPDEFSQGSPYAISFIVPTEVVYPKVGVRPPVGIYDVTKGDIYGKGKYFNDHEFTLVDHHPRYDPSLYEK